MGSILSLFGGKDWSELSNDELQDLCQSRRRDITAIMEQDAEDMSTGGRKVTLGKKPKASGGSEDLL